MTRFVPASEWQPPPPPVMYGELTVDGTKIMLVARGDAWEMRQMGTALSEITPLQSNAGYGAVSVPATWAAVTQLAHSFTGNGDGSARWTPGPLLQKWIIAELTRRTAAPAPLKAEFPAGLALRPYQEEGAAQIAAVRKFLLLDEPGTGKTCTTIAGLAEIQARGGNIFPMVIIVPSWSVADVWIREISTCMPSWTVKLYGGPKRGELLEGPASGIYVSTYATARIDAATIEGPLCRLRPVTVIADEFHLIKGNSTKQSLAVRRIARHAENVIGLSGTPVTQDTGDIYPMLDAADPLSFPDRRRFTRRYCKVSQGEYGEKIDGLDPRAEPELRTALLGVMRRVAKADVLSQLPPKIYSVRYTGIPPEWRKAYDGMEADMLADLPDGGELPAMDVLTRFQRLSQLACSAADVEVTEETDEHSGLPRKHYQVTLKAPSWKADELLEILAERRGKPVAVFAPSRQLIEIAGAACEKAGLRAGYITGRIPERARQQAIDTFQAGKLDVILATTGAGGTGITLTAAGTAVFLQRPWFSESVQAEDRVHRIGSEIHEHGVEIIDIVARDTIDARRRELLIEHAGQLGEFVQDSRLVREMLGGLK